MRKILEMEFRSNEGNEAAQPEDKACYIWLPLARGYGLFASGECRLV